MKEVSDMKGLIVKELTVMKKGNAILFLFACFLYISNRSITNTILFLAMMYSFVQTSNIANDEMSKWTVFSLALPFSRRDVVTSKYTIIAGITLVCAAVNLVVSGVIYAMGNGSLTSGLSSVCLTVMTGLIYPAIALPLTYKFSAEKGRIISSLIVSGCAGIAGYLFFDKDISTTIGTIGLNMAVLIAAAAAVVLFAVSWLLSVKFYEKREL